MLTWLLLLPLGQSPTPLAPTALASASVLTAQATPQPILQPQEVRPLPGSPDSVPVFNSNSPELVQTEGILLSTFPPAGMESPTAHLNYAFDGRFDIFSHHVARGLNPDDRRTLYLGVLLHNPGRRPVTVSLQEAISYLSQQAGFNTLPASTSNMLGTNFSGPGSRTMNDVLRDRRQPHWPSQITIAPGQDYLLMNVPIPLRQLAVPTDGTLPEGSALLPPQPKSSSGSQSLPTNARSTLMRLISSGPVYAASLAMYAPATADGGERVPTHEEWRQMLQQGTLAGPRDHVPTAPQDAAGAGQFFYGRVGGVSRGSQWRTRLTDSERSDHLTLPAAGDRLSYVLSTVDRNTFGTGQVQSAFMVARYADTAYRAHGNYGLEYGLTLPLYNPTNSTQTVTVSMQTPVQDESLEHGLRFFNPPEPRVFFRGTVLVLYKDDEGRDRANFLHLVQHRGQQGDPLVELQLPPGDRRPVQVQFLYPPDATPPQVLTIHTLENPGVQASP